MYFLYHRSFLFTFLLICLNTFVAFGKDDAPKWGKVSQEEKKLKKVSYDPEAHAVVLAKTGKLSYFSSNFQVQIYFRIKVLDPEGVSVGDIVLPFYSKNKLEKIDQVRAQTLEILEDGSVVKHKLEKDQIFETQANENWSEIRFAMPAVKAGSIIEYSYTLTTSNFTFLEGWIFQDPVPTLYSYYKVALPGQLVYNTLMHGPRIYQKYKNNTTTTEWELRDLPALKHEPFTYNLIDYAEKVQFQLHSYLTHDPVVGTRQKEYMADWQSITNEVLSHGGFWNYLHKSNPVEDILTTISVQDGKSKGVDLATKIYAYVQKNFTWNEFYGLSPDKDLKKLLAEKSGNGPSINLLLVNMLLNAGFEAHPVYISTKAHGQVNPAYPVLSKFNHVIALVKISGKEYLLDASGNPLPFGLLPENDLNGKGLVLSKEKARWVDIFDLSNTYTFITYQANLTKGKHTFQCTWKGFNALDIQEKFKKEDYKNIFWGNDISISKDSVKVENSISTDNTLKANFYFTGNTNLKAEKVFYDLPLPEFLNDNPFKNEKRLFPIDFGYTSTTNLVYNIILPEHYFLEGQPENIILKTPDEAVAFIYQASRFGNELNIQIKVDIKKSFIGRENYFHLRELYSKMISHCQQPLVLVKAK